MSGGKGGSSKSQTTIPKWIEDPAVRNIARAEDVAKMGYQPYYGPEVAAFSPMQVAGMQSAADAATAFGMAPQMNVMSSIPQPTEYAGGIQGYGSGDIFDQTVNEFQKRQPQQAQLYSSQFVGPNVNGIQYDQPPQYPVMGLPGGKGGVPMTQMQQQPQYQPIASQAPMTPMADLPRASMQEVQQQMPATDGGGFGMYGSFTNPGDMMYANQMINDPGNRFTYGDQVVYQPQQQTYGQTYYSPEVYQSQPMQVDSQMAFQNQGLIPQSNNTPDQSQAAAIDFWNQTQAALDAGDLNTASKFYDQYQAITGTKEPMYGLSALDSTKYNQVRFGNG